MSAVYQKVMANKGTGYVVAVFAIATVTAALKLLGGGINSTTVALALLSVVLFVASVWGSRPAVLTSLLAVICFNFFYLPPVGTFRVRDPDNWIALFVFLVTAMTTGELSARAKRRAEEANAARHEVEGLYQELQDTFEQSSQAQALKQSERLKSALLDAVTHDLRTPLTSIKASVTALLEELKTASDSDERATLDAGGRKEMLEIINEEADRLDRFIEGLMELARIDAGEMQLRKQWASVEEIVAAALNRAKPLTRQHRMEVWLDDGLPSVRVDERAVAEVLYTLVDNATKYSAPGTRIRVEAKCCGDGKVKLSVGDEGKGIPVDLRERVFEKFFRALLDGESNGKRTSGTGMGLAIAKGIVEAHEGRIWIEDGDNQGAKVIVLLPTGDETEFSGK